MKTEDILKHFLPSELLEHFELVDIETSSNQLSFCLEEKSIVPPEHLDKDLESKGFTPSFFLNDFPVRDKMTQLKVRRRKWRDKRTGNIYTRNWDIKHPGTTYTKEFASFLKKMY